MIDIEPEIHLKKIVEILVERVPKFYGLCSIILYGGFARGEGRMLKTKRGYIPYGDYDLMVITRKSLPDCFIQDLLEGRIYKEVMYGTSIDITNETASTIKTINCDISSYDLLKTGKNVWGEDLLSQIKMDIDDVPLMSFWRVLNNRFNVILMEYELQSAEIAADKRESLKKSVIKLYLDLGGYLTFGYKRYSPFYEARLKNLKELKSNLNPSLAGLVDKIEEATEEKLNPVEDAVVKAGEVREALGWGITVARNIMGTIMDKNLDGASAQALACLIYKLLPRRYYQDFIAQAPPQILKKILAILSLSANLYENLYFRKWAINKTKFSLGLEWRSPIIINMAVTILLISSLIQKEKREYIRDAADYLKRILHFSARKEEYTFEELKMINTQLWLGYTRRARKRNIRRALTDILR